MSQLVPIKRALLSVADKTGLVELGRVLDELKVEIISTGGTLKALRDAGVHAIGVSSFTGSPEVMGGRVKTLHPKVHGGILFRRDNPTDVEQLKALDGKPIDLVVVNLYQFEQTIAQPGITEPEALEQIDIGGPATIRSAAKNFHDVTCVVDPHDYPALIEELRAHDGETSLSLRRELAARAFTRTAAYDQAIAGWFAATDGKEDAADYMPASMMLALGRERLLRYGENPHQMASLYRYASDPGPSLVEAEVLSGKELSYNNYNDLAAVLEMVLDFDEPFAVVVKHTNPCGAAVGTTIAEAYQKAYDSDPLSAYGSIIGLNRTVDRDAAERLHETPFVECILAPSFDDEALKLLRKKKNRRLLALPGISDYHQAHRLRFTQVRGGFLVQTDDQHVASRNEAKLASKRQPSEIEWRDLLFAWKIVKHTKSNAIVIARNGATVGIGMGQTSRVDAAQLAVKRAGERARGGVMASDAFFPMPDGLQAGLDAGVVAIIQPGGAKQDTEIIQVADDANVAMIMVGIRHFRH